MKNFLVSLLFSFSVTALFIPCDLNALKSKNTDKDVTPEEQATLNAKLSLTARNGRLASTLKLLELGADLDAHNEQEKSPREMLEEVLRQPESPMATYQQEFTFNEQQAFPHVSCYASYKAINGRKIEVFLRKREIRNKLLVLVNQKNHSSNQASPVEHTAPELSVDTTVSQLVSNAHQPNLCPESPTSPNNPYYRVLCCASYRAVRKH
jgi:hypothetical protein